ncbi:YegP family protein [Chitinophaga sp. 22536]|uniref:YegP family protein n=1 Tax=unclassified Chitinophaga TaxID=2619133 RepID=UPI003F8319C5
MPWWEHTTLKAFSVLTLGAFFVCILFLCLISILYHLLIQIFLEKYTLSGIKNCIFFNKHSILYRFVHKASNGEIILVSETYATKIAMENGIASVVSNKSK